MIAGVAADLMSEGQHSTLIIPVVHQLHTPFPCNSQCQATLQSELKAQHLLLQSATVQHLAKGQRCQGQAVEQGELPPRPWRSVMPTTARYLQA